MNEQELFDLMGGVEDLKKRLRYYVNPDCHAAAKVIESLEAEISELREYKSMYEGLCK